MQGSWPIGEALKPLDRVIGDSAVKASNAPLAAEQLDLITVFCTPTAAFRPSIFLDRTVFGAL